MKISKRLASCAKYTEGFNNLADIGTDHAQLPIYAITNGFVLKAQAIDNKQGPYIIAMSNVINERLQSKIKVVYANGIAKIDDDTDVVVISGLGGELISNILLKDSRKNVKRFILQPNNHPEFIRKILPDIGYSIVDEIVLEEQNKIYDIIVIEPGKSVLNEKEMLFGPVNLKMKPYFFTKKLNKEISQYEKILPKVTIPEEIDFISKRIALLKEVLQ